ncbi:MAG: cysteine desulfurase, partial [Phycisphaeraceae bacterium]
MTTTSKHIADRSKADFDPAEFRAEFPILSRTVHGKPLIYLDNAATTQKPRAVIDAITYYYTHSNANVHRGVHALSEEATEAFEGARDKVRKFLNAPDHREIIFTRGCTEGMNLVAQSYAGSLLKPGDEVLITHMEHHSGIVPWQIACQQSGAKLKVVPITACGELDMATLETLITARTKIVSLVHISNALGTINPVKEISALAHKVGAVVLVDGAQATAHMKVDVQDIGCDFYAFSGHKMFGPTGIGALWGRTELLEAMPPYQGGGDMIKNVTFEETTYNDIPYKFEAGTPDIAGAVGLGAAIDFIANLNMAQVTAHEQDLLEYGTKALAEVPGLRLIGTAAEKSAVLSFVVEGQHPYELGQILDRQGVAIRTGHHCAQPVMDYYQVSATVRASMAPYNTREDIDALVAALHQAA